MEIAKTKYKIEGVVSGAIASKYQKERVDKICKDLGLQSIAPLWQTGIEVYIRELLRDFEIIITGIAADGLTKDDLGKKFDMVFTDKLKKLKVNLVGEGGEFETFVLNCPLFKKKIKIEEAEKKMENERTGQYLIKKVIVS